MNPIEQLRKLANKLAEVMLLNRELQQRNEELIALCEQLHENNQELREKLNTPKNFIYLPKKVWKQ